ncbi:MAG: hypothetical protein S4CHLAM37_12130 [Chlamydiia bacterium]|nr:hypothetical protein [Chlamydiia bacterium]
MFRLFAVCFFLILSTLSFATTFTIPGSGSFPINHRIRGDGFGNALCTWTDFNSNMARYSFKPKTGVFSEASDLGPARGFPVSSFDSNGNGLIAYNQATNTIVHVYRKKGDDSSFSSGKTLTVPGKGDAQPSSIAVADDGTFIMAVKAAAGTRPAYDSVYWTERPPGDASDFSTPILIRTFDTFREPVLSRSSFAYDSDGNALFTFAHDRSFYTYYKKKGGSFSLINTATVNLGSISTSGFGVVYEKKHKRFAVCYKDITTKSFKGFLVSSSGEVLTSESSFYQSVNEVDSPSAFMPFSEDQAFFSWVENGIFDAGNQGQLHTGVMKIDGFSQATPSASFSVKTVPGTSSITPLSDATASRTNIGLFGFNAGSGISWGLTPGSDTPELRGVGLGTSGNLNHSPVLAFLQKSPQVYGIAWLSDDQNFNQQIQVKIDTETVPNLLDNMRKYNRVKLPRTL